MIPKDTKKSSKKPSKGSSLSKNFVLSLYEKKVEKKVVTINTLTLIPISNDMYILGPSIVHNPEVVVTFPYVTSEE